ncbi:MAG: AMP-binding protein [Acidobacteria bacterium]|nr:AMP-binding protein [Acidobacteriota bacterium]
MPSFYDQFTEIAGRFAERTAVEVQHPDRVDSHTFAELHRTAESVAAALHTRGIGRGDRCAILADNDFRWVAAYLGVQRLGGVAVPLDTAYKARQIAALLRDSGAKLFFVAPRFLAAARDAIAASGASPEIVLLHGAAEGLADWDTFAGAQLPAPPFPCPAAPTDPAVILYSSGTTGDPKGVVLTHGNLLAEAAAVFDRVHITEADAILGVLPLFHALAQVANLMLPFCVGASVVYLEQLNTTELLRALRERGITVLACVPQFFYLIHQRVMEKVAASSPVRRFLFRRLLRLNGALRRGPGINLGKKFFRPVHELLGSRMRFFVTGGSRFDAAIGRDLFDLGVDILQAYGLTECSGAATLVNFGDPHVASVGRPFKGVEIKILPPDGSAEDGARDGEVCIRGDIVMQGYFNRPDANAETLRDGWLHSGDLGYLDPDGRLYITGRKKEIIITSSGKNLYPEEIEAHYLQSPFIKEICVLGLARPGEPAAERLHAVVVPNFELMRERKILNAKEILRFEIESLSVGLPSHKRALSYDIWNEELPRTTTRKLKRFQIQERVLAGGAESESATSARSMREEDLAWAAAPRVARALEVVRAATRSPEAVHPDANIELELGLDSMERVELLTQLQVLFGSHVTDEVAHSIYTVRELVDACLSEEAGAGGLAHPRFETADSRDPWEKILQADLEDDAVLHELLRPRPVVAALFFVVLKLAYVFARLFFRFRVRGRQHLPEKGPFLLCPNHESYLDAFLLASALPFRHLKNLFFVGASEYFATPFTAWLARQMNIVPVDPDTNLLRAMQAGAFGLRHGKILILFPEGERTIDGEIKKFKKGAPILSLNLGAPIVPVALENIFEIWPRSRPFNWRSLFPGSRVRARARMAYGRPIVFSLADSSAAGTRLGAAAARPGCDVLAPAAPAGARTQPSASVTSVILSEAKDLRAQGQAVATAVVSAGEAFYAGAAEQLRAIVASMMQTLRAS